MSQSPSSAITTFSPILTRRRARPRDKLDSAATCDGHCKNNNNNNNNMTLFNEGNIIYWLPSSLQYGPP